MSGKGKRRRRALARQFEQMQAYADQHHRRAAAALDALPPEMLAMMAGPDGEIRVEFDENTVRIGPAEPQEWSTYQYADAEPLELLELLTPDERRQIREAVHPDRFLEQLWYGNRR